MQNPCIGKSAWIAAIAAAAVLPSSGLGAATDGSADALDCAIRTTVAGGAVRLEALATARSAAAGSYRLLIAKSGTGGSTRNMQSGAFELRADETEVLSRSSISVGPQDRYEAELTIEWNGHSQVCRAASEKRVERNRRTL